MSAANLEGFILPHEHILIDYREKDGHGASWSQDLRARATKALNTLAEQGCAAIVDCTPPGYGRTATELGRLAADTGIMIYPSTGSFCEQLSPLPDLVAYSDVEGLARYFTAELIDALGAPDRAVIKAATSAGKITPAEERVLRAAGRASNRTGTRIVSHTSYGMGQESVDLYESEGVPAQRVMISHVCANGEEIDYALALARRGCYLGLDRLGHQEPGDPFWIQLLTALKAQALLDRALLSHDSVLEFHGPVELADHASSNTNHLIETFVPKLASAGFSDNDIRLLLVQNPHRWLTAAN